MGQLGFIYINSINPNKNIQGKYFYYLCTVSVDLPKVTQLVEYTLSEPGWCGSRDCTMV